MKLKWYLKFYTCFFLFQIYNISCDQPNFSQVLEQYQNALTDLVAVSLKNNQEKLISLESNNEIASAYQRLIQPSVLWISGYARIVKQQMVNGFNYFDELGELFDQYHKHLAEVESVIKILPVNLQDQALDIFHTSLHPSVLQVCYDIVEKLAYDNDFSDQAMTAAYQAYQLAFKVRSKQINIHGCSSLQEFVSTISQNMQTLFQGAIKNTQVQLRQGLSSSQSVQKLYEALQMYFHVLVNVFTNNGDAVLAQEQQNMLVQIQAQQKYYTEAQKIELQADQSINSARNFILLDISNSANLLPKIKASSAALSTVANSYLQASQLYVQAQDVVGNNAVMLKANLINQNDLLLRFIQELWCTYLIDQSDQGVYTFPTLQSFIQADSGAQKDNAVEALNNLSSMISNQYQTVNVIIPLITNSDQNLLLETLIASVIGSAQNFCTNQNVTKIDDLFDLPLMHKVKNALFMLTNWSNALAQATSGVKVNNFAAQAMSYAKELDNLFIANVKLKAYVPFFPSVLASKQQTWQYFTAQFLVQAQIVETIKEAMSLTGTVKIIQPVQIDMIKVTAQAQTLITQAKTAEKVQSFSKASSLYFQAMKLYTQLYENESDANEVLSMFENLSLAKTKFVACNFASVVQAVQSKTFDGFNNVPTSYVANSYQLSFDAANLMNSSVPVSLSSLQVGTKITTISLQMKNDIFAFLKGYLVAQYLFDKGYAFTDYFSTYDTSQPMIQSSAVAVDALNQVTVYLNNFKNININSVMMNSSTSISIDLNNFPLLPVIPFCSTVVSAGTYYQSAATLFNQGDANILLGGQSYVPGNDLASAEMMFEKLAYCYVCLAQAEMKEMQKLIDQVLISLGSPSKSVSQVLPIDFDKQFKKIKNLSILIQSSLVAEQNSAQLFFSKAGATDLAALANQQSLQVYAKLIDFGKKCLVGDPTTNNYQSIISTMNDWYIAWASQLSGLDAITAINKEIAEMYVTAGEKALGATYTQPEFPNFEQIHYMVAANYYASALKQYESLQDLVMVKNLQNKLAHVYYQACSQGVRLYFHIKKFGAMYASMSTSWSGNQSSAQMQPISFQDLNMSQGSGSQGVYLDSQGNSLYSEVVNLLLFSAMVYEQLSSSAKSSAINSKNVLNPNHEKILLWLQGKKVIDKTITHFGMIPLVSSEKILNFTDQAYDQFVSKNADMQLFDSLNQLFFNMVKNQYLQDYLGLSSTNTAKQIASGTMQFLNAVKAAASSATNSSLLYVG